jgi:hypothetical protein
VWYGTKSWKSKRKGKKKMSGTIPIRHVIERLWARLIDHSCAEISRPFEQPSAQDLRRYWQVKKEVTSEVTITRLLQEYIGDQWHIKSS